MAVNITSKSDPKPWEPGMPVPDGYIVTKHGKLMKKPSGKPKGTISLRRRQSLLPEDEKIKDEREAHEAVVLARKIVDANNKTDQELADEAKRLLKQEKPKTYEGSMERRTGLLAMVYKLQIRGLTEEQIGQQLNIAPTSVKHLLTEVHAHTRLDPKKLDIGYYMGESLSFFQEIRQMALLMSADGSATKGEKLNSMRVALDAEHRKNEFLTKIGMYSPTILQTVERWVVSSAEVLTTPPEQAQKINLAAELGRVLARRHMMVEDAQARPA